MKGRIVIILKHVKWTGVVNARGLMRCVQMG